MDSLNNNAIFIDITKPAKKKVTFWLVEEADYSA